MSETTSAVEQSEGRDRFPKQIKYIVGNEACERFSYYGMKGILAGYISGEVARGGLGQTQDQAAEIIHWFGFANYFMPLLGAWVSDKFWGRYHTILWISLFYCLGHGVLAMSDLFGDHASKLMCLYGGLALIAFGSGGIKPCVSAFVGDQFRADQSHLMEKAYGAFYWSINFGSFFAYLLIPRIRDDHGYGWAFGVPGILMGLATVIFVMGTRHYVRVAPTRSRRQASFTAVLLEAWRERRSGQGFWDGARRRYSEEEVGAAASIMPVLKIFVLIPVFWALFEQSSSTWVMQGFGMEAAPMPVWLHWLVGPELGAEQMQSMNPLMVMLLVPLLTLFLYPRLGRWIRVTPLRRIGAGLVITSLSFVVVAGIQQRLEAGATLSILWQILPYIILTLGEVLVSVSGLEFAYTQAAGSMKSIVMSLWLLTIALGNVLVVIVTSFGGDEAGSASVTSGRFLFYAGITLVFAVVFAFVARTYRYVGSRNS